MVDTSTAQVFEESEKPYEKTMGEWTVLWWNWAMSIPKEINPIVDEIGRYSHVGQRNNVWFLAGRFGREDNRFPHRRCSVPFGMSILFPVLNCEANRVEYPYLENDEDLINKVSDDIDTIIKNICLLDGKILPSKRIKSDPRIFDLNICVENAMDLKYSGVTRASSDGYWVFLKSLSKGEHSLEFEGSCEEGRLCAGATYNLIVE